MNYIFGSNDTNLSGGDIFPFQDAATGKLKNTSLDSIADFITGGSFNVTVGFRDADYICDGTADDVQISQALSEIKTAGGGTLTILNGTYDISSRVFVDACQYTRIVGQSPGGVILNINYSTGSSTSGALTFYSDISTPTKNIQIEDIYFDHNGNKTPAIVIRGNTSDAVLSENFKITGCEFYNRLGDSGGTLASVLIMGSYTGVTGSLKGITIENCLFRDNTGPTGSYPYSINILTNDLNDLSIKECRFENLYGTSINIGGSTTSSRKNWVFKYNKFYRTKQRPSGFVGTIADIFDSARRGVTDFTLFKNEFDDDNLFVVSDDNFHLALYKSTATFIQSNLFLNSRAVLAPGYSAPVGNEDFAWIFTNNIIIDAVQFSDFDGHYAGIYDHNIFIRVKEGYILGGYGVHTPSQYTNNMFYNCCTDPSATTYEWQQGIFLIEAGGNVVSGNTIYNDSAVTALRVVFSELYDSVAALGTDDANVYKNNTFLGDAPGLSTFYLNSAFKHEIIGNTGLSETRIINNMSNLTVSSSSLSVNDKLSSNFTASGQEVQSYYDRGDVSGSITLSVADGKTYKIRATDNITPTLTTAPAGRTLNLIIEQDGTGSRTVTWPSNFKKAGGTLTLSTAAGAIDSVSAVSDGTNWREVSRSMGLA